MLNKMKMLYKITALLGTSILFMLNGVHSAVELSDDMKEMAKMLHDQCVDESGVNEGLISACGDGNFAQDSNLKCYIKCLLMNMGALSDDGELDADAFESVLPPDLHDPLSKMIAKCKDAKGGDPCELAFNFYKCLYDVDPAHFIVI